MAVKRTIRFVDIDGKQVEQDWYFSLGKTDILDMDLIHEHYDDVAEFMAKIEKDNDTKAILVIWREFLLRAVGKRVETSGGATILAKSPEILDEFRYSGAFEQLFSELVQDENGAEFFNSIMPAEVQEKIAEAQNKTYTKDEMLAMTDDEFDAAFGTDLKNMTKEQQMIAFQRRTSKAA